MFLIISAGVTCVFLALNISLAVFLRVCGNHQYRGAIWEIAPLLAWLSAILQLFLQLFLREIVTPRWVPTNVRSYQVILPEGKLNLTLHVQGKYLFLFEINISSFKPHPAKRPWHHNALNISYYYKKQQLIHDNTTSARYALFRISSQCDSHSPQM